MAYGRFENLHFENCLLARNQAQPWLISITVARRVQTSGRKTLRLMTISSPVVV